MAHVPRRLALSRRTLLGAGGAALALPWLDAMRPAFAAPAKAPRRIAFVFLPNGQKMDEWTPKQEGAGYDLPPNLEPLAAHRKQILVLSGLTINGGRALGDGPGDHAREGASFLTCAHPFKTGGADIRSGVSVDQVIAGAIGGATAFPSLEVGLEPGRNGGACDSGYSCAYTNNVSWRSETQPMPKETDPRAVFARLFGDPDAAEDAEARARRAAERKSVLDAALGDAKKLLGRVGPADRRKLDEYFTALREVETRLERDARSDAVVAVPEGLRAGGGYPERVRLFYDLLVLAFQADRTRVATCMLGNAGSNTSYAFLDVPEGHHELSHHGRDAVKLAKIAKIGRFHSQQLAYFLERLTQTKEEGEPLLERTMVLYGGALADPDAHAHHDLPVLLAGKGHPWKTGRHLKSPRETPMANLYLSLCEAMGAPQESFADSSGALI